MNRNSQSFFSVLVASDIITILFIVLGIIVAFFLDQLAIKLIGIAISLIAIVSLFVVLKQRLETIPPENKFSKPASYNSSKPKQEEKVTKYDSTQNNDLESDFKIKEKDNSEPKPVVKKENVSKTVENETADKVKKEKDFQEYTDDFSSVRIVGSKSKVEKVSDYKKKEDETKKDPPKENKPAKKQSDIKTISNLSNKNEEFKNLLDNDDILNLEPRKEFDFFVMKALEIIKQIIKTKTTCFLIVNDETNELILESFVSNVTEKINTKSRYNIGNDAVSQVFSSKKYSILTNINPSAELDLIPYYSQQTETKSFIGVPVIFEDKVIGVLAADSKHPNAYDDKIVAFFAGFTKLLAAYVNNYTEKYQLLQASKTLDAIKLFSSFSSVGKFNNSNIIHSLIETIDEMFDCSTVGIVGYNDETDSWSVVAAKSDKEHYINNNDVVIENSLIGNCIYTGNSVYVNKEDENIRIFRDETNFRDGFFIAAPLRSAENNYGALFVIGNKGQALNTFDINLLELLAENAGVAIEKLFFLEAYNSSLIMDYKTGILNKNAFEHRFNEEYLRSKDFNIPQTLFLIKIDNYEFFNPDSNDEKSEKVYAQLVHIIEQYLRPYDLFGKLDNNVYSLLLTGANREQTKIASEKIRNEVANSMVEYDNDKFSVTVSIGANNINFEDSVDKILSDTTEALEKSMQKTNTVTFCN